MKKFLLFLCLLILCSSTLLGQDEYPRPLEEVDVSQIWHSTPGVIPENNMMYDPIVSDIINQTNLDSLVSYVRILSGEDSVWIGSTKVLIQNRGSSGGDLAADYLIQKLASYNLEIYDQIYSSTGRNVYAMQEGYLYPEQQYIICAHYDAVDVYCADDNATGVAAVIEAARILSKYDFKYTLIYALWDEEEIGLVGSNYYASQASSNQDDIQGVLNMDMLAWDGNNDNLLDIHTQNTGNSNDLANLMVVVNYLYGLSLNPVIYNPGTWQSDHSSFWNHGYGAILLIEAYYGGDLNPYYHSIDDRIDKFNLSYFHNLSKLSIGTISSLLEATQDTLLASITPDLGYQTYPVNVQIKGVNTHFQEGTGTEQVWFSMDQETILADNFNVNSNTLLSAQFQIPATAAIGLWDVIVECSIDGIISKAEAFEILPPPAIIVVQPDSIVVGVLPGSTKTKILTISNEGETDLNFNIIGGFSSTNYALLYDGMDDYVEVPDNPELSAIGSFFTLEFWIKIDSYPNIQREVLGKWGNGYIEDDEYAICIDPSGILGIGISGNTGQTIKAEVFSDPIQPQIWKHITVVFDANISSLKVYGDGILEGEANTNTIIMDRDTDQSFFIGAYDFSWSFFKGLLDDVRICNVARTQSDIQEDMYQQLSGSETGLLGYWQFNEGTGDITSDKTVNANNGSLFGGVQWTTSSAPLMPGWFFTSTDSGICSPHTSMDIELLFDATEVDTRDYHASIIVKNNDPFTPSVVVPIHMIVSSSVGIEDGLNNPLVFNLEQNYPNPFNPSTTIKYSIPMLSKVKLTLFNLLGEEVTTLVNEEKIAGNYSIEFNATLLPSGVYFYQLRAGEYTAVKKMILLK
ncbi:MAG: M28 family peptidase [bacterium]|nr:M28 family peptidase [bacterium]